MFNMRSFQFPEIHTFNNLKNLYKNQTHFEQSHQNQLLKTYIKKVHSSKYQV